jgi:hypothetical protein
MEIAAIIVLAIALAGAIGGLIYMGRELVSGLRSERASFAAEVLAGKAQIAAEKNQVAAENQRDEALAGKAKAEAERDATKALLVATQQKLADELGKKGSDAAAQVAADPDALDRMLSESARVPGGGDAPEAAGADHGHP